MVLEFVTEKEEPQEEITPTLTEVFNSALFAKIADLKVALPAKVVKYDEEKQAADVQPVLKKKYLDENETVVDMPVIYNVPVAHPRAGKAYIHMPLKKDHYVLLVFSDRSLDKWLSTGGNVDPDDTRLHHISDAIAYPGCYPFNEAITVNNTDDIIIKNQQEDGDAFLETRIKKNNHLQVLNQSNELISVLWETIKVIREAVVYTSTGPQQLRHSQFQNVHNKLKTFLEQ